MVKPRAASLTGWFGSTPPSNETPTLFEALMRVLRVSLQGLNVPLNAFAEALHTCSGPSDAFNGELYTCNEPL
ncbi:MAG TPA: hypothetical protein VGX68_06995 [Thermoanaerobaculia bacterium]|jgi:hypothetical protein|nr:hypothetical protein [Thermoanaerobaculia bacterium]